MEQYDIKSMTNYRQALEKNILMQKSKQTKVVMMMMMMMMMMIQGGLMRVGAGRRHWVMAAKHLLIGHWLC
jgi:hypothetical protein